MNKGKKVLFVLIGILGGFIIAFAINFLKIENMRTAGSDFLRTSFIVYFIATSYVYIRILEGIKNFYRKVLKTKVSKTMQIINTLLYIISFMISSCYFFLKQLNKSDTLDFMIISSLAVLIFMVIVTLIEIITDNTENEEGLELNEEKFIEKTMEDIEEFNFNRELGIKFSKPWNLTIGKDELVLFPKDSDLTVRIRTYDGIEENGYVASISFIKSAYEKSLDATIDRWNLVRESIPSIGDYNVVAYSQYFKMDGYNVFGLYVGIMKPGMLISMDVMALNKKEVYDFIKLIKRKY